MWYVLLCLAAFLQIDLNAAIDDNRIVGGRPAEDGEFPYQVSLRRSFNDNHFCGGSLIGPSHVLTAAHCMYYVWGGELPPIVVSVVAGQLNISITQDTVYRNASKITIHPKFNKTSMNNDVAIIEVEEAFPVYINPRIATVPLKSNAVGLESCIVTGWGVQDFESKNISEILLAAQVDIIDRLKCDEMYGGDVILQGMLCAGVPTGEKDACQGDSGGALSCNGFLTGVVSTGKGCADPNYPGIYADVANLLSWIEENANVTAIESTKTTEISTTIFESTISKNSIESGSSIVYNTTTEAQKVVLGPDRNFTGSASGFKMSALLCAMCLLKIVL